MSEPVRLAKRVAAMVPCSRREAEQYIEGGWVRVDGAVVEEPQARVGDEQHVTLDKGAVATDPAAITLLLHKPAGPGYDEAIRLLQPASRIANDDPTLRTLKRHFDKLAPLLPMPALSSGLAVYSQDWRIVRKLTEDALRIEQELIVEVEGQIRTDGLPLLNHGLAREGWRLPPIKVSWQSETRLRFALKGMDPAIVTWMCEQVGLRVKAMKRIRLGRVPMAALPPGQWRYLGPDERF